MTWAKKGLYLTRLKSDPIKDFRMMSESSRRPYFSLDLVSNCHLECTYCILQSYLENNPVITVYTNFEEILERLATQIPSLPEGSVVGTGRIADSLALDDLTGHTREMVPFFGKQDRSFLELKTKSAFVRNLLGLDHRGKTVVSWSVNPQTIIDREEYKTASLEERLKAASQVVEAGYPVGFHFDPMIFHERWKENYQEVVQKIFKKVKPDQVAWISIGTLRFPARQARIMAKRFPKNKNVLEKLVSTHRKVLHYPDDLREEMQGILESELLKNLPADKIYRCMDF